MVIPIEQGVTPVTLEASAEDGDGMVADDELVQIFAESGRETGTGAEPDSVGGERDADAPVTPKGGAETDVPAEAPSMDSRERQFDLVTEDEPVVGRAEERNEDDGGPADTASRTHVVEVGAGNGADDADSPRKGWWQRLLE